MFKIYTLRLPNISVTLGLLKCNYHTTTTYFHILFICERYLCNWYLNLWRICKYLCLKSILSLRLWNILMTLGLLKRNYHSTIYFHILSPCDRYVCNWYLNLLRICKYLCTMSVSCFYRVSKYPWDQFLNWLNINMHTKIMYIKMLQTQSFINFILRINF